MVIPTGNLMPIIKNLYFNILDPYTITWGVHGTHDALCDIWYPQINNQAGSSSIGLIEDFDINILYHAIYSVIPGGQKIRVIYSTDVSIPDNNTASTIQYIFHIWNNSSVTSQMSTVVSNLIDVLIVLFRKGINSVTNVVPLDSPTIT